MLADLRKFASGWIAKGFLALLILSFVIWGVADVFRGFGQQDLAQIGSVKITTENFRRHYTDRLQQLNRQFGGSITPERARSLGLDRQVLGELVSETLLDEKTRLLRLRIDDETLVQRVHANEMFRGPTGQFDPRRFAELLRANGYTEARYLDAERKSILRQQLGRALGGQIQAPAVLNEAIRRYESEERSIEYIVIGRSLAGEIPAPSPGELSAYFEERKTAFRAPEYRKLSVLILTPESLGARFEISEADLRKAFDTRRERLSIPERREIEQIVFPNMEEAKTASARIAAGTKFEEIIAERGLAAKDVALGLVAKRDILDRAIADTAFALTPGKITDPVAGRFGAVLLRVNRIEPGKEPEFAEVADSLRKELSADRAKRDIVDLHNKIEDERASGSNLAEVATKLGLKINVLDAVDRSGRGPDGKKIENIVALDNILSSAFNSPLGVETDPIELRGLNGYVWYEVSGITPSRERTLEEARERVETRWRDDEMAKRLSTRAVAIRSRLDAGERFESAAQGLRIEKREKLRRGRPAEGIDGRALALIFETAQGKAGISVAEDGVDRILFRVSNVNLPADAGIAAQRIAEFSVSLQDDLLVQYAQRLQNDLGVWVNEIALRKIAGGDTGN